MKKLNVGDSINFKDGRAGIVEDYDDKYYYIKDNNTNIVKMLKDDYNNLKDIESFVRRIYKNIKGKFGLNNVFQRNSKTNYTLSFETNQIQNSSCELEIIFYYEEDELLIKSGIRCHLFNELIKLIGGTSLDINREDLNKEGPSINFHNNLTYTEAEPMIDNYTNNILNVFEKIFEQMIENINNKIRIENKYNKIKLNEINANSILNQKNVTQKTSEIKASTSQEKNESVEQSVIDFCKNIYNLGKKFNSIDLIVNDISDDGTEFLITGNEDNYKFEIEGQAEFNIYDYMKLNDKFYKKMKINIDKIVIEGEKTLSYNSAKELINHYNMLGSKNNINPELAQDYLKEYIKKCLRKSEEFEDYVEEFVEDYYRFNDPDYHELKYNGEGSLY